MKKISLFIFALICSFCLNAQVNMPAASPTQVIEQDFGLGKIKLTYSRPSIKGRSVFGQNSELAPLGQLWRTGANAATRISFTSEVTINGVKLDTGSYVIYTIPGETEWEVIFNKGLKNWGSAGYKNEDDVVRLKVPVRKLDYSVESFAMQFDNMKPESCDLYMIWSNVLVSVSIKTDVINPLRKNLEAALQNNDKKAYWQAANFYFEMDKNNSKALENVNRAIEVTPEAYYMYLLKAKIQQRLGDKSGAKESAEKCATIAAEKKNDDYVRSAKKLIASL